jgi:nitroreductase
MKKDYLGFNGGKKMEAILSRRSIRKYTNEPVPNEIIKELLKAAMSAPSAVNEQPWHFIVIKDRKLLDEIPKIHPYSQMLRGASVAILVCGDLQLEKAKGFWHIDCSAATQNLLIAVQAKGLGAVWVGCYPREERIKPLQKLLGIPDHVIPFSLIPIGYPAEQKTPANRYNESRIHYDGW